MISEEEMMDFLKDNDVNFKMFLMLFKVMFATEHIKEIEENQKENTISMEYYNQVLEKTVKLALELNLTKSLEYANLFTYLLWNGYFSLDKKFAFKIEDRLLSEGMYFLDIFKGNGVCLNISEDNMDLFMSNRALLDDYYIDNYKNILGAVNASRVRKRN